MSELLREPHRDWSGVYNYRIDAVFFSGATDNQAGPYQRIAYYGAYLLEEPKVPPQNASLFALATGKQKKEIADYNRLQQNKIEIKVGRIDNLLNVTEFQDADDQLRGYAAPTVFGESIDEEEFQARLEMLAKWINPRAGSSLQEKYVQMTALDADHAIRRQQIIQDAKHQKQEISQQKEAVSKILAENTIDVGLRRKLSNLDTERTNFEISSGLATSTFSVSSAIARIRSVSPGKFMLDCRNELTILQSASDKVLATKADVTQAQDLLSTIGEDDNLQQALNQAQELYEAALLQFRAQSIRVCYLAMHYDQQDYVPALKVLQNDNSPRMSNALQNTIDVIGQSVSHDAPEGMTLLANKIIKALYNIPGTQNDETVNNEIVQYFSRAAQIATQDSHVAAIERQLALRFGDYLSLN